MSDETISGGTGFAPPDRSGGYHNDGGVATAPPPQAPQEREEREERRPRDVPDRHLPPPPDGRPPQRPAAARHHPPGHRPAQGRGGGGETARGGREKEPPLLQKAPLHHRRHRPAAADRGPGVRHPVVPQRPAVPEHRRRDHRRPQRAGRPADLRPGAAGSGGRQSSRWRPGSCWCRSTPRRSRRGWDQAAAALAQSKGMLAQARAQKLVNEANVAEAQAQVVVNADQRRERQAEPRPLRGAEFPGRQPADAGRREVDLPQRGGEPHVGAEEGGGGAGAGGVRRLADSGRRGVGQEQPRPSSSRRTCNCRTAPSTRNPPAGSRARACRWATTSRPPSSSWPWCRRTFT